MSEIVTQELILGDPVIDYKCDVCGKTNSGYIPLNWHTFTYSYKAYIGLHEEEEFVEYDKVSHVCDIYCYYSFFKRTMKQYTKDRKNYRASLAVIDGFNEPFAEDILRVIEMTIQFKQEGKKYE